MIPSAASAGDLVAAEAAEAAVERIVVKAAAASLLAVLALSLLSIDGGGSGSVSDEVKVEVAVEGNSWLCPKPSECSLSVTIEARYSLD
jgi:hypothetical protein